MANLPMARGSATPQLVRLVTKGGARRSDERKSKSTLLEGAKASLTLFRKHREKKEDQCRVLEDELHRLYHLISVDGELQKLRFENEILRDIMARHSMPLPPGVRLQEASWAEVIFTNRGGHDQQLQVKFPGYQSSADHSSGFNTNTTTDTNSPSIQSTVPTTELSAMRYVFPRSISFLCGVLV